MQLLLATFFCVMYLGMELQARPYLNTSDAYLATGCSGLMLVFFLLAVVFKFNNLTELSDIAERMTPEQTRMYRPNELAAITSAFIVVFSALVLGGFVTATNIQMERRITLTLTLTLTLTATNIQMERRLP